MSTLKRILYFVLFISPLLSFSNYEIKELVRNEIFPNQQSFHYPNMQMVLAGNNIFGAHGNMVACSRDNGKKWKTANFERLLMHPKKLRNSLVSMDQNFLYLINADCKLVKKVPIPPRVGTDEYTHDIDAGIASFEHQGKYFLAIFSGTRVFLYDENLKKLAELKLDNEFENDQIYYSLNQTFQKGNYLFWRTGFSDLIVIDIKSFFTNEEHVKYKKYLFEPYDKKQTIIPVVADREINNIKFLAMAPGDSQEFVEVENTSEMNHLPPEFMNHINFTKENFNPEAIISSNDDHLLIISSKDLKPELNRKIIFGDKARIRDIYPSFENDKVLLDVEIFEPGQSNKILSFLVERKKSGLDV